MTTLEGFNPPIFDFQNISTHAIVTIQRKPYPFKEVIRPFGWNAANQEDPTN
jgi:hypothetical protein